MLIDVTEYMKHLQNELPDFNFTGFSKIEDYKNNSEVYEICFEKHRNEKLKEYNYRMVVGYLDFTPEEQKENFVHVAKLTYKGKNKEDDELEEKELKEKKK